MRRIAFAFVCCAALAGCLDTEERAERHYQSALELLDEGDTARAMIELRTALQNDETHFEARKRYGDVLLQENQIKKAYAQYLRLIEQYPNTVEVRRILAEIALDTRTWDEVRRHGNEALALAPDDPANQALAIMIEYHDAKEAEDVRKAAELVAEAEALLAENPKLDTALRLMIDWHATGPEPGRALPYIERLLERHPNSRSLLMAHLRALNAAGQQDRLGDALRSMYDKFPDDAEVANLLLQWYYSRNETQAAEAFLRDRAGADDASPEGHFAVIRLLRQTKGPTAALIELDRLAAANEGTDLGLQYAAQASLLRFETGADRSTDVMQSIVNRAEGEELRNDARFALASMHRVMGNMPRTMTLIEEILQDDPFHTDTLVLRASLRIRDDNPSGAVNDLRAVLDQSPRNVDALLMLAEAQQRLGNLELAEQRLAQAVEVSNDAPQPAILFARFQVSRGKLRAAERVLSESVAKNIDNLEAAALLAELHLKLEDNEAARALLNRLIASENPAAAGLIRNLQATILFKENRVEESLVFLRNSLDENGDGTDDLGAELQLLRILILSGRMNDAQTQLSDLRDRFPDSIALRVVQGNMLSLQGDLEGAIAIFRQLMEEDPDQLIVIQRLYSLLKENGQTDEASALLESALERFPEASPLILLRALELEREGAIDEAIAGYEKLYEADPSNITVANNYASMLAYYRDDPESLALADKVSEALVGSDVPAFMDTLGFILLRKGIVDRAILNFQAATRGLPDNPTVAFNLATAYERAGRIEEARAELERGFQLAGDAADIPRLEEARELYEKIVAN